MVKRLLAVLLLIPLLDALFLVLLTNWIGWQLAVLLVVLTALLGMLFVRAEGRHTIEKLESAVREGRPPTNELLDGALLIAAGAFLLTPGLVTDSLGFLLVLPPTRYVVRTVLKKYVVTPYIDRKTGGMASGTAWTFGFPNANPSESGSGNGDTYDLGSDAYDIHFDTDDDTSSKR